MNRFSRIFWFVKTSFGVPEVPNPTTGVSGTFLIV